MKIPKKKGTAKPPFLTRKVSLPVFILSVGICCVTFFVLYRYSVPAHHKMINNDNPDSNTAIKLVRQNDGGLTNPLLFVENTGVDSGLLQTRDNINDYIDEKEKAGVITSATVYLEKLNSEKYIEINADETYEPASLMKIVILIVYLKEAEANPALLSEKFDYTGPTDNLTQTITDKTITPGKSYTVKDLLYYMIVYSDNEAYYLLTKNADDGVVSKTVDELRFPLHVIDNSGALAVTAGNYSHFFKVLYNASYLSRDMSQYALTLLTESTFKDGLAKPIDPTIKIAHKFGERTKNGVAELHEFGIVYLQNNPYLIGVMTKGPDMKPLPGIISGISKLAYDALRN